MINFSKLERTWIVAEIGVNHEGNFDCAADMIRQAAACGVDAVKFQTFQVDNYISKIQPERYARTKGFELSRDEFRELAKVAGQAGVTFFSTPFHESDVAFLDEFVPLFKISSGDLTYLSLIRRIAQTGKPIMMSTGLGSTDEIRSAINTILEVRPGAGERGELALMHCVAAYPTPAEEANLLHIRWLARQFGVPVGFSDHTIGTKACELAVSVGARVLEKHFTYRKENQAFHDHLISADPQDMKELVAAVRNAEQFLGSGEPSHSEAEAKMIFHMRRSIGACAEIPAGVPVQREWLTYLRPAWGLPADRMDFVVGRKLKRTLSPGDLIRPDDVEI